MVYSTANFLTRNHCRKLTRNIQISNVHYQETIDLILSLMLQRTLEQKNKLSSIPATPAESDNESDTGIHEFIRYKSQTHL